MAYEWVGPVATAATGIAGVTFTWLTSRNAGKTQLAVVREQHGNQGSVAARQERKDEFTGLLGALSVANELLAQTGGEVSGRWERAAEKARWEPGTPHDGGYIPPPVLKKMREDDSAAVFAAVDKLLDHTPVLDEHMDRVRLCGGEAVIAAVNAVRDDYIEVMKALGATGQWRYLKSTTTAELLNACRIDLGYPPVDLLQRPQARQ